MVKCKNVGEHF